MLLADDFSTVPSGRTFTDGQAVDANWRVRFAGYGSVSAVAGPALQLEPKRATRPGETHSALVISDRSFADIDLTVSLRTGAQLRTGSPPNPWEAAWLLWRYTDDTHFYSLVLKPNGWELAKQDPAYRGNQRFLATGSAPAFPTGAWYRVRVRQAGSTITVWVDGHRLVTFTDHERPYLTGNIGLYDEDARTRFAEVVVRGA